MLCKDNGLKRMADRLQVAKWNREQARAAVVAARKAEKNGVDKPVDSGILEQQRLQKLLKDKIASGEITITLNNEKQAPHMEATRTPGRSYFTISQEELQQIVIEKHGTGQIIFIEKSGQIKEVITCDRKNRRVY